MTYPGRWAQGFSPRKGEKVPLSEELVPTTPRGRLVRPTESALINFDINYNNGKIPPWCVAKWILIKTSQL